MTVTGATGLIGPGLIAALRKQGAQVTVLSRDPIRARATLDSAASDDSATGPPVEAVAWDLMN